VFFLLPLILSHSPTPKYAPPCQSFPRGCFFFSSLPFLLAVVNFRIRPCDRGLCHAERPAKSPPLSPTPPTDTICLVVVVIQPPRFRVPPPDRTTSRFSFEQDCHLLPSRWMTFCWDRPCSSFPNPHTLGTSRGPSPLPPDSDTAWCCRHAPQSRCPVSV
jgi:hypothetical protein